MDTATAPRDAAIAARDWRPMAFGVRAARDIRDPLLEPAWFGPRVLVLVAGSTVEIRDEAGAHVTGRRDLEDALVEAVAATGSDTVIADGHLTAAPTRGTVGVGVGFDVLDSIDPAQVGRQMLLGSGGRRARRRDQLEADRARRERVSDEPAVAFVAIDLLWLDETPLLDVPLLERKRLLESALEESALVRRSVHVRPPVEAWFAQWRAFGFREMSVRSANSRYRPGDTADDWTTALLPKR